MDAQTRYCTCGEPIKVITEDESILFVDPKNDQDVVNCPGCKESIVAWLCPTNDGLVLDETTLLTRHPDTIAARKAEVSRIKLAINNAIPTGVQVASIIAALAELQKDMVELLYEEEDEEEDDEIYR